MDLKHIAKLAQVSDKTIQRDIQDFNKKYNTSHESGVKISITDNDLLSFIKEKRNLNGSLPITSVPNDAISKPQEQRSTKSRTSSKEAHKILATANRVRPQQAKRTDLQEKLSSNWLVMVQLVSGVAIDVVSFGIIAQAKFGDFFQYAGACFAILGLTTGIGALVTYNRIKDLKTAEAWGWFFIIMQFAVFELMLLGLWVAGSTVMASMIVLVSKGVQRSIKN